MSRESSLGRAPATRRHPVGAEPDPAGGVNFRVWAPSRERVEVVLEERRGARRRQGSERLVFPLEPEDSGYFSGLVADAAPGTLYRFRLDGGRSFPDPASRFQPDGPAGPSEVVDPSVFPWTDGGWGGLPLEGQALYEMHIGTFTREGTWEAAARVLSAVAETEVTVLSLLPVADFHGRFGWGYDGVNFFAPTRLYGRPEDFRAFVDRAHELGLGVVLDVVYNHVGTVGNYLREFSERWFSDKYRTAWGETFNFDDAHSRPVRDFFLANVAHWIEEYHLDGFRLDAANEIHDASPEHIITALARRARSSAGRRTVMLVAENEAQESNLVRAASEEGHELDGTWNEDFHHSLMVALTGRREGYYTDYEGRPQELVSLARRGFLYQGQGYRWQNKRRGTPAEDLPPFVFVSYLQNHDQVANTPGGERIHQLVGPACLRAATAFFLLAPATPLLFQGQEFGASSPFLYFADMPPDTAAAIREGRARHLAQFRSLATAETQGRLGDPTDPEAFEACKLDHGERDRNPRLWSLHRDLLRLRRRDPALRRAARHPPEGAVLGPEALALRFAGEAGADRLLLVNLGRELWLRSAPEPLLAPPRRRGWTILWSSEDPDYGGWGTPPPDTEDGWRIPARAALLLAATGDA